MLELAGRIGLGMNVADFLQLQTALHRDRIIDAAADKENILCVGVFGGKPLDPLLVLQGLGDLVRQGQNFVLQFGTARIVDGSADLRKLDGQKVSGGQLRAVGLGRRDGDLRAGEGIEHVVRLPRDG